LDALVTGIATVDPRVYNRAGAREDDMYHKLRQTEFARKNQQPEPMGSRML